MIDNPASWYVPYGQKLVEDVRALGHDSYLIHKHKEVVEGDILCLLACERKFAKLELNGHNLVVHESLLPEGKGWSPLTWQILEGKKSIPITLFEATEQVDAGVIYLQEFIEFQGHELLPELKAKQGNKTNELIVRFIKNLQGMKGIPQSGDESFYPRRKPKDSELNIDKSIEEQFNLLRVCDNERYPAFFIKDGIKFLLRIEKA